MEKKTRGAGENRRAVALCLAAVVLIGAALRLYHLGAESQWYDEGASLYLSRLVDWDLTFMDPDHNTEAPMNAFLVWLWYGFVGSVTDYPVTSWQSDFAIRLLPCLLGIGTIVLVFLVTRLVFRDDWTGVLAALLFALAPLQIRYAQELRIYSFYVAVCLLATYFVLKALEEDKLRDWAGVTLSFTVLVYSHFISVWTIFAFNTFFVVCLWPYRRRFWKWFAANALMMALIVPALRVAWRLNQAASEIVYQWYPKPTWKTGFITFKSFFADFSPITWAYWPLFLMGAAFTVLGIISLRKRWTMAALLGVLVVAPVAGNVLMWSLRHFSFYEHRLFIFSGVAALMAVAGGMRSLPRPRYAVAGLVLFAGFTVPCLADYYAGRLHPVVMHRIAMWDKVDYRSAVAFIEENYRDGDLVCYASHFMAYPMHHYFQGKHCRLGVSERDQEEFAKLQGDQPLLWSHGLMPMPMKEATEEARRVWFLESFGVTFEWKPQTEPVRAWLDTAWRKEETRVFDGLSVTLYTRGEAPSKPREGTAPSAKSPFEDDIDKMDFVDEVDSASP